MADRPIIFSAPMIRALLDGRKTQTRRVIKLPPKQHVHPKMGGWEPTTNGGGGCFTIGRNGERIPRPETVGIWHQTTGFCMDATYQKGDRLWVKEAHMHVGGGDPGLLLRRATWREDAEAYGCENVPAAEPKGWRSPLFMPRALSRLTLIVTDVRVQRLQDISEDDVRAEGVSGNAGGAWGCEGLIEDFSDLWDSLHGPDAWDANPWVAAISFTVHRANIDACASDERAKREDAKRLSPQGASAVPAGQAPDPRPASSTSNLTE